MYTIKYTKNIMKKSIIFYAILLMFMVSVSSSSQATIPPYWVCYDYGTYTMCVDQNSGQQQFIRK